MFDIFDLLTITWRFFQSFDHQSGSRWNDINLCLTILNCQFNGYTNLSSLEWPWRYRHQFSWETNQVDQLWEPRQRQLLLLLQRLLARQP